jgi:hypothetical protein
MISLLLPFFPAVPAAIPPVIAMRFMQSGLLLCLARRHARKKRGPYKHSRYRKGFFMSLLIDKCQRRYQKIPRCALIPLVLSPWRKLLELRNDQAYITMAGFNRESFDKFLEV